MNNQTQLTSEEVKQNHCNKVQQARVANQLINEEIAIRKQRETNPELFDFIEALGKKGGLSILKQLHVMLTRYIQLVEYNGGKN